MAQKARLNEAAETVGSFLRIPRKVKNDPEKLNRWFSQLANRIMVTRKGKPVYGAADHIRREIPEDAGSGIVITQATTTNVDAEFRIAELLKQFDRVYI